jgi:Catalase
MRTVVVALLRHQFVACEQRSVLTAAATAAAAAAAATAAAVVYVKLLTPTQNVNAKGEPVYVKYHFKTDQGIRNLPADKVKHITQYTTLCYTILYHTILYYTTLHYTTLHYTSQS